MSVIERPQILPCDGRYAGLNPVRHPTRHTSQGKATGAVNPFSTELAGSIPAWRTCNTMPLYRNALRRRRTVTERCEFESRQRLWERCGCHRVVSAPFLLSSEEDHRQHGGHLPGKYRAAEATQWGRQAIDRYTKSSDGRHGGFSTHRKKMRAQEMQTATRRSLSLRSTLPRWSEVRDHQPSRRG